MTETMHIQAEIDAQLLEEIREATGAEDYDEAIERALRIALAIENPDELLDERLAIE